MNKFKKGFIGLVTFTMIFSLMVITPATAATDGDLIKMDGNSAVYYLNGGKRYVFPNEKTYKTWYPNFDGVVVISQSEMEGYPLGGNVTYRPGTRLVKITTIPTVYAVEPGGNLRSIISEANAISLWGSTWNKQIDDVPDSFFVNYTIGANLTAGQYPTGTIAKEQGSATTYYIDGTTKRPIATGAAFDANKLNWSYLQTASDLSGYTAGTSITAAESGITTVAGTGTTGGTAQAGSVNVALSANTPASTTLISDSTSSQALIPFLTVNFTAPASGDVIVTNLKFKRTGISADGDIANSYLYDGVTRLAEGGSVSSAIVTFNSSTGLFTVPAGTTKAVTFKIDLTYSTAAGKTMAFELTEVTTSNNATINGSLPIGGNLMNTALVTDLGYVTVTNGTTPSANEVGVNPGEVDFEMYKITLAASDQDLQLEYLKLTLLGSINTADLANLKLVKSGVTLATGSINANRELIFDLSSSPYAIEKGQSPILSVRGDVVGGSTRTFKFSVEYSSDLVLKDTSYNVYITPFGSTAWSSSKVAAAYEFLVSSGSLAISLDTSSPTENVPASATNVKLATFKFEATGEDVKVKALTLDPADGTNTTLDNGKILLNGVQVGSTKDLVAANTEFTFGSSFIVPAGEAVLVDVYTDIKTSGAVNITSGNVKVNIVADADGAQGVDSLETIPVTATTGTSLGVTAASITVIEYTAYGNQSVVKPATQAKIGSFIISAGAYEGISVNTINIDYATSGVMQNMKLFNGNTQIGTTKVTLTSTDTTDNTFSVSNLELAANESKVIDIYADILAGTSATTIDVNVGASGTSGVTGTEKYHSGAGEATVSMQTMTITTGAIYSAADGSRPDADIIIAGSAKVLMNAVKFTASNDAYTVTKLRIDQVGTDLADASNSKDAIGQVILEYKNKAGNTITKTDYIGGSDYIDFSGLSLYVPKDDSAVLSVYASIPTIASGAEASDRPDLDFISGTSFSALGEASNIADEDCETDVSGNPMIIRKTKPTVTPESLSSSVLAAGTRRSLIKFSIAADVAGDVYFKELNFSYSSSSNIVITASTVKLYRSTDLSTALNTASSPVFADKTIQVVLTTEEQIGKGTSKSYTLQVDLTGTYVSGDFISTQLLQSATDATAGTSTTYDLVKLYETGGLLWSDGSATNHTSSSADYHDCTYVKSLPVSQTLSK